MGKSREEQVGSDLPIDEPCAQEAEDALRDRGCVVDQLPEQAAVDREKLRLDQGFDRGVTRLLRHQADLAEEGAAFKHGELAPTIVFRDRHDRALDHDVETVGRIALTEEHLPRLEGHRPHAADHFVQAHRVEVTKEGNVRELAA